MNALLKMKTADIGDLYVNDVLVGELDKGDDVDFWYKFRIEQDCYALNFYEVEDGNFDSADTTYSWYARIYPYIDGESHTDNPICRVEIDWSEALDDCQY